VTDVPAGKRPERLAHMPDDLTQGEYTAALAYLDAFAPGGVLADLPGRMNVGGWSGMRLILGFDLVQRIFDAPPAPPK